MHPIKIVTQLHDQRDVEGRRKWCMTEPRIELINDIAKRAISEHNERHPYEERIRVIDAWPLTVTNEWDRGSKRGDMAHYGDGGPTYSATVQQIWATVCGEEGSSSREGAARRRYAG